MSCRAGCCRPPRHRGGRDRDPRGRRIRRRRRGRCLLAPWCRRDRDDRAPRRWRARRLLGRRRRLEPRLLRRRPHGRGRRPRRAAGCRSARSFVHYAVGPEPARCRGCPAVSARSTPGSADSRGRASSSRRSGSHARASRMPPPHAASWPCWARSSRCSRTVSGSTPPAAACSRRATRSSSRAWARPWSRSRPRAPTASTTGRRAARRRRGERRSGPGDLARYEARWEEPVGLGWLNRVVLTRGGPGVPVTAARLPRLADWTRRAHPHAARCTRPPRGRRAHDQSRRGRPRRTRVRAHVEPRPGHGRLPPRPPRLQVAEQHARRGRPRPRAAAPGRSDGQDDGADARPRRRAARANRLGGRHAAADGAWGRGGDPRRGSRPGRAVTALAFTGRAASSMPSWASRRRPGGAGCVGAAGSTLARPASLLRRCQPDR